MKITGRRCWRCDAIAVQLVGDPMQPDSIGVCRPCANQRVVLRNKVRILGEHGTIDPRADWR